MGNSIDFFCENCGGVLTRGKCNNPNCTGLQSVPREDKSIIEEDKQLLTPTKTLKETIINIPFQDDTIRFLCFSDWRSQKLADILKFTKNLNPKPDIILYAGDDVNRFADLPNSKLLLGMVEKGLHLIIPYHQYKTQLDEKVVAVFLTEEAIYYTNIENRYSEIQPPSSKQVQKFIKRCLNEGLKEFEFKQEEGRCLTACYSLEEHDNNFDDRDEEMDLSQFLIKFKFIADFLNQFQFLPFFDFLRISIWDLAHSIVMNMEWKFQHFYYRFQWSMKEEDISLSTSPAGYRFNEYSSFLQWLNEILNPLTTDRVQNLLQEQFVVQVTAVRDYYQNIERKRRKSYIPPIKYWSAKIKLHPSALSCYITHNFFEELASSSTAGLFAIIGNDCSPSHRLLIQGKKVTNLGEHPVILNDFVFLGLEGTESIESSMEKRVIRPDTYCRDIGYMIYSQKEYQAKLSQLLVEEYKKKIKVILSHPPPFRCLDLARRFGKVYIGSIALREVILSDSQIKLVVCGHVHLHGGKYESLNEAIVVNCASHDFLGAPGIVAIIDLDKKTGKLINLLWKEVGSTLVFKIWGIGPKFGKTLEEAGYETPEDLLRDPLEVINEKTHGQIGLKRLIKFQMRADAVVNKKVIYQAHSVVPSVDELKQGILIDIETDLNQSEIWCIGLLFQGRYQVFFLPEAGTKELCKNLFNDFIIYLEELQEKHENCSLYCYSGTEFDFRVLEKLLIEYDSLTDNFINISKIDLFHILARAVILPIADYKLKDVAQFLEYSSQGIDDNYDGIAASSDYYAVFQLNSDATEHEKEIMKQKLIIYNEEDLRQVVYIWETLFSKSDKCP